MKKKLPGIVFNHPDDGAGADGAELFAFVDAHAALLDGTVDALGLIAGAFKDADLQVQQDSSARPPKAWPNSWTITGTKVAWSEFMIVNEL